MTYKAYGPFNIQQNNSAYFTVEFIDSNGNLTVPSAATLSVNYTNTSNANQTDVINLALINSFYTGTWSSTSAALGLADWSVVAVGSSSLAQIGQIRVIDP